MIPNPEFDKAGYCAKCHTPIAEFDGDQKVVRLLGSYRLAQFKMNDGSTMQVALCDQCHASIEPKHTTEIMESVYKGWLFEIDHYLKWPKEKVEQYEKSYGKKHIVERHDIAWSTDNIIEAVGKENMVGVKELEEIRLKKDKKVKLGDNS